MYHRNRTHLNDGWQFQYEADAAEPVTLPHTWNALDTMNTDPAAHYRRGTGRYQRLLNGRDRHKRHFVQFEAVAQRGKVWFDDDLLGEHLGGYTPFTLELPSTAGTLTVLADNQPDINLIPSDRSDFFLYGGITRNVWLYETGPLRVARLHLQPKLEGDTAVIAVTGDIDGQLSDSDGATLLLRIENEAGESVVAVQQPLSTSTFGFDLPPIAKPERWSPERPVLYTVTAQLHYDGAVSDEVIERIGFRTFEFPAGGPFYLNGERLLLRGTHRHEDWAGLGCAVPDELTWQEMRQIKGAGFNFIRLGHYPQAEAVLDACDELGIIVWEEIPWCRGGVGGELFKSRTREMLREMVAEHFNRPSILFWGVGNELDWESDHADTTDDDVYAFLEELHALSHALDDTRLTALRRYDRGAAAVDVYSPSIWSGWYRGRYEDYEAVIKDAMTRFPRMIHTEWGGDNHVGRHNSGPHLKRAIAHHTTHEENPGVAHSTSGEARASLDGDWSESYMLDLMEWHLQVQNRLPNLAGTAQWAFKDFGTPLRLENPIPYVNQKGLVDRAGRPKDVYFLFQAYQTNTPVCYIESPSWPLRTGDPGAMKRVRVYSNCERVELFVNGRAQGTKFLNQQISPAGGLVWFVPLQMGANKLRAVGMTAAGGEAAEHTITQTLVPNGVSTAVKMQAQVTRCEDGCEPAAVVAVQLVTSEGVPVLNDECFLTFCVSGGGELRSHLGTPDGSAVVETANGRASILVLGVALETAVEVTAAEFPALVVRLGG